MAYAEKRDGVLTGFWYGEVVHKHAGRFRRRFETKREAMGYEAYVKATGEELPGLDGEASGRTFGVVAAECKAHYPGWKTGKDKSVLQRLEWLLTQPLAKLPIEGVALSHLEDIVRKLEGMPVNGKPRATQTINNYLSAASTVLSYAVSKGYRQGMPAIPWFKAIKGRKATLTEDQENAVCAALASRGYHTDAFLVHVLVLTGMRVGELMGLKPDQIRNETIALHADETKGDEARLCYVEREMADELRAIVASGTLTRYSTFYKRFKGALKSCGYSEKLTVHSTRHTTATRGLERGIDAQVMQQLLGHKNIKTTLGYRHVSNPMIAEAAKKLLPRRGEEPTKASEVLPFAISKTA